MTGYLVFLTIYVGLYSLFALGLNLQWGYAGLINFGHVAFMTVGAYTTVLLSSQGVPLIVAVLAGIAIAALLGLLIGMSTLRLREDYLAIVTIGVSEMLRLIALNEQWLTRGSFGVRGFPLPLENFAPNLVQKYFLIALLTLLAIFAVWLLWRGLRSQWREGKEIQGKSYQPTKIWSLIIWGVIGLGLLLTVYLNGCTALLNYNYKAGLMLLVLYTLAIVYWGLELLARSPWGRVLKAIREDEEIATALGKNVFWYKLQAFMLGGAIAGVAGAFYAWQLTTIYPANFQTLVTFNVWTMVVLGGAGKNPGALLGAVIFWAYDALTRFYLPKLGWFSSSEEGAFRVMVIGLILMLLMLWRPQGILGKKEELTLGR
ncbi:MAG: branched-chain amino acid ABC transporter permease [Cyanobacteria bacterium J06621_12]